MARKPSVNYWASKGGYGCWHKGEQVILAKGPDDSPSGPTYLEALGRFKAILTVGAADSAGDGNTVRVVLEMYLRFLSTSKRKKKTLDLRHRYYRDFCRDCGEVRVRDLTHFQVYGFCDRKRAAGFNPKARRDCGWGDGNVRTLIDCLQAALNWAAKSGLIPRNPLTGIDKPSPRSRGRDCILTPEQHAAVMGACTRRFAEFVTVLEATGARGGEIAGATAAAFNPSLGALVYHAEGKRQEGEFSHKTGQRGKDRTIFLTGESLAIVRRLVAAHPSGPLFRNRYGKGWTERTIYDRFRRLQRTVGLPRLTAMSYRHTFATRWLEAGGSIDVLSEIMGNTPAIIRKHYSHLCGSPMALRGKLEEFRRMAVGK